jgi:UDP-N-acetylenolpyruvoylglucosamine reductase
MSSIPFTPFRPANSAEAAAGLAIQVTDLFHKLQGALPLETVLRRDEPLARRTTLRVGGPADIFVEPDCEHALVTVLELAAQMEVPLFVIGRGSNLLIRDGGVRGVVLSLAHSAFSAIERNGSLFQCGAGARLKAIATEARRAGVTGLEFLEGIPGSLGGALRMNAGAMNSWTFNVVERLRYVTRAGLIQDVPAAEVPVTYRACPLLRESIALGALLRGTPDDPEAVRARMDAYSRKRWDSQPNQPSAGCTFKNPAPTLPAGKLIDELGLKGTRVGDAMVSDVHANFFVNLGNATARDVLQLIELVRQRAREARGVELEVEVEVLGEDLP